MKIRSMALLCAIATSSLLTAAVGSPAMAGPVCTEIQGYDGFHLIGDAVWESFENLGVISNGSTAAQVKHVKHTQSDTKSTTVNAEVGISAKSLVYEIDLKFGWSATESSTYTTETSYDITAPAAVDANGNGVIDPGEIAVVTAKAGIAKQAVTIDWWIRLDDCSIVRPTPISIDLYGPLYDVVQLSGNGIKPNPGKAKAAIFGTDAFGATGSTAMALSAGTPVYDVSAGWPMIRVDLGGRYPANPNPAMIRNDFDGDGRNDLIFRRSSDQNLYLMAGNGNGTWKTGTAVQIGNGWQDADLITAVGDFTGDGKPDLIFRNRVNQNLYRLDGNGTGGWKTGTAVQIGNGWQDAELMTGRGDFSGDGKPDVIYRRISDKNLYMMEGNGTGGWKTGTAVRIGNGWQEVELLTAAGDFSGDGKPDLIWRNAINKNLYRLDGNGTGGWKTGTAVQIGNGWQDAELLVSPGDWGNDGKPDLIWRNAVDKSLYRIDGNGSGGWITGTAVPIGMGWNDVDAFAGGCAG
ncbi:FG-GAP repeat domain-containing protein [Catellatospora tritici]|uniref:FG-GAP repeat domain-containing protein n=1 Tax=Catellatospora tritici TaxID=2851566 RepID=UPI001C2D7E50|nr:VCBS repeat-containing protein [Catellatospora tritici]MBV1856672.1 VCBS repeat-containing protein [Catellatospora tritici]